MPAAGKRKVHKPAQASVSPKRSRAPAQNYSTRLWLLAAVFILAAFLRFHDPASAPPGLFHDEAVNGVNAMEAIDGGGFQVFYPENNGREGLFINIQALFLAVFRYFGTSTPFTVQPWMLRFPSAIFGTLTIVGLFFFTRILTGSEFTAGAAAFLCATSFWHINFSRIGFRAISALFWLVWALFFLLWGFSELSQERRRQGYGILALAGLFYGAGFHSYIAYRITPLLILLVLAWMAKRFFQTGRPALWLRGAGMFLAVTTIIAAPLAIYFLQHPHEFFSRINEVSVTRSANAGTRLWRNIRETALMLNVAGDRLARHNVPGRPELFLPVGILFLLGVAMGLRHLLRRSSQAWPSALCLVWLAAAALPAVLSSENVPHALRSILMIPPCFILAALGLDQLLLWLKPRVSESNLRTGLAALAVLLAAEAYWTYFQTFVSDPRTRAAFETDLADTGREIAAAPLGAPKYIVFVNARLDQRGNPADYYSLLLLSGGYNPAERADRNIHIVVNREEAARVAQLPGAYAWVLTAGSQR